MWVNKDALKKAGIAETAEDLAGSVRRRQEAEGGRPRHLRLLHRLGHLGALIEQFSAWHNVPIGTKANGLDGFDTVLEVQHAAARQACCENLVELQKDKTYDYSGRTNTGEGRFTSGECAIFLTSSAFYRQRQGATPSSTSPRRRCRITPTSKGAPQNSIIGGASLWVMGGKKPEEYKGVAKFFTFLSDTDRQAKLHQESGYLPITKAAYEKTKASGFYEKNPILEDAAEGTDQQGADREFARPALRQHGADARRLGRGDRGGARRQEDGEGGARRGRLARQRDAAAVRAHRRQVSGSCSDRGRRRSRGRRSVQRARPWKTGRSSQAGCCPICCSLPQLAITLIFFYWPAVQAAAAVVPACRTPSGCRPSSSGSRTTSSCCSDPDYYQAIGVTVVFSALVACLSLTLALLLAVHGRHSNIAGVHDLPHAADLALCGGAGGRRRALDLHVPARRSA